MIKLYLSRWLPLAWTLLPLTAAADETQTEPQTEPQTKPLWEIQARLDGATSPVFSRNIKELLGKKGLERILCGHTVLRMAGFENDKTPERDWIAEIRGVQGMKKILPTEKKGAEYAAWSDDSQTLKLAGPKTNKGQVIEAMVTLKDEVWLSGWIDFNQLKGTGIQSQLLKLAENASFSASGTGDVVTVSLRPVFDSPVTATVVSAWLAKFKDLLQKVNANSPNPQTVCKIDGTAVTIQMDFKEQDLEQLCEKLKHIITKACEENPSYSGH
jgi:hypothetical protein